MSDFSNALEVSASGLKAQAQRLKHVSENIANADTPGYRRKTVAFEAEYSPSKQTTRVSLGRTILDRSDLQSIYEPSHPLADETGRYEGSNVNLIVEITDAREAQRSYEANLKMFEQSRQMASSLMELLRR